MSDEHDARAIFQRTRLLSRLDRVVPKLDRSLPAEQLQQHEHAFVRTQNREHPDLLAQRTADHPHPRTRREPARLRQFNKTVAFTRFDLGDNGIRDVRRLLAAH